MIWGGRFMRKHADGNPNGVSGYRSKRSRLNKETWRFAQEHCGRLWQKIGWAILVPIILAQIPFYHKSEDIIGNVTLIINVIGCTILILSILPTERALKKNFNEDGTPRE